MAVLLLPYSSLTPPLLLPYSSLTPPLLLPSPVLLLPLPTASSPSVPPGSPLGLRSPPLGCTAGVGPDPRHPRAVARSRRSGRRGLAERAGGGRGAGKGAAGDWLAAGGVRGAWRGSGAPGGVARPAQGGVARSERGRGRSGAGTGTGTGAGAGAGAGAGGGMVDSVYRTRSLGVAAEGLPDQYADGRAARVWQLYIGDTRSRTAEYRSWLLALLRQHRCRSVLDVACGTGVDSIMLLEEGFQVTSVDASDKMLKYALKERWERRKEEPFDRWVIEEANWLTLEKDLEKPGDGFDAVICLGNSFAHLPDFKGDQSDHKLALRNIASMVRPGGVLVIDHRNYDHILATGCAPPGKNIYYKSDLTKDITTSVLLVNNKAHMVTLDYTVQVPPTEAGASPELSKFRLSYYPHRLEAFTALLKGAFQGKCQHSVLGDFQPYTPGQAHIPCYFIHVVKKTA
uniref:Glycine N-methyltransferase n=4 Tax=Anatidae TaxID=8830 RepID=A0A8B9UGF2_9AVES